MLKTQYFSFAGKDYNAIKVGFDYDLGGRNYFSGGINARGLYIYFIPVQQDKVQGVESFQLFGSGPMKHCILEMERKNQKKIDETINEWLPKTFNIAQAKHCGSITDLRNALEIPLTA